MSVQYISNVWTDFWARKVLANLRSSYPNAEINPHYTVATRESDSIVIQIQIDLNDDKPRERRTFWQRLKGIKR